MPKVSYNILTGLVKRHTLPLIKAGLLGCLLLMLALSIQAQDVIHISTENTSLVLSGKKGEKLLFHYYGSSISQPEDVVVLTEGIEYYQGFGIRSEHRTDFRVTHSDGNLSTQLLVESIEQTTEGEIQKTIIGLKDPQYPFFVTISLEAYRQNDLIAQHTKYTHQESGELTLFDYTSAHIPIMADRYYLTHFFGDWKNEFQMKEIELTQGSKVLESVSGTMTTRYQNPSFLISLDQEVREDSGEVIGGHLAWPGNWKLDFQIDDKEQLHIRAGINPYASEYRLSPNTTFTTPKLLISYSNQGKGHISRNFHAWARQYGIRHGDQLNRTLLNSWEGVKFNFDQEKVINQIEKSAQLGAELYVLDDGWFGNKYPRNTDKVGLGDWQVNKKKLPGGLKALTYAAKQSELGFGIWVETEMVNPKSELFEQHPEWVIKQPNRELELWRYQAVLDLTNPEVQDFVVNSVNEVLKNQDISYVKWDSNRPIFNPGSTYLPADRQSHLFIEYNRALLDIFKRVSKANPNVTFQVCSSGGNRVDYGSLQYFDEFWTSDNTDPVQRIFMQWGTSHFFPAMAMASHATKSPNKQTGRATSLKFRFDVAMSGRLGLEFDPTEISDEDMKYIRQCMEQYGRIRPTIQKGLLYRLVSPYEKNYAALMYVSEDQKQAVVFGWQWHKHIQEYYGNIKLKGLSETNSYEVTEINLADGDESYFIENGKSIKGDYLMSKGISNMFNKANRRARRIENDSFVLLLEKVQNEE